MRFQLQIWLDSTKDDEHELLVASEELKRNRQFAKTMRDGLRLILDLRKGNTAVLLELYPWIATRFIAPTPTYTTVESIEPRDIPLGFHVGNNSLDGLTLDVDASEIAPNKPNSTKKLIDTMIDGW